MSANTADELSLSYEDIEGPVTLPVLEDRVEEVVEENLVFRDAFRSYNATNINSNVVQIPVPKNEFGRTKVVGEGAEFPRSHEEYELKEMFFDKFGFEIPITMEAEADSRIDLTQDQIDRQAEDMARDVNARAYEAIENEVSNVTTGTSSMTYSDILDGREELVKKSYDPDLLIGNVEATHDLSQSGNFLEASSDVGADARINDGFGRILGMDIVEDDSSQTGLGGDSGPGALMVDTNYFGYEGERTPITTESYSEDRSQTDVYRIFSRMGWLVTQSDAAVLIE